MEGRIKFIDRRSGQWGFVVPLDGSSDVHFSMTSVEGPLPSNADVDAPVEFELAEDAPGRHAKRLRLLVPPSPRRPSSRPTSPAFSPGPAQGDDLKPWAYVPYVPFRTRDGRDYSSVLEYLAKLALEERWHFGTTPDPRNPYPILDNYFSYTFTKLRREEKVFEKMTSVGTWAAFNTGLVDRLYGSDLCPLRKE